MNKTLDLERQKQNFKNHKATFTDYGNIKIVDFKAPNTAHYRIRFLFEEDYCRLHISGALGELIATSYSNMTFKKFSDFVHNVGYFKDKVDCHSKPIYVYDESKARKDIRKYLEEYEFLEEVIDKGYDWQSDDEKINEFLDEALCDFSDKYGVGSKGYDVLSEIDCDIFESVGDFGKESTRILDLYMLAFELAMEQLENQQK